MRIDLAYGEGYLRVDLPDDRTTVIEPSHVPGIGDERSAVLAALDHPIATPPLRAWIKERDRVCIAFTDLTRATPNERIIPWLLEHLAAVPRENITLLNAVGTHRPNTAAELDRMLTPAVARNFRVLNHSCHSGDELIPLGTTRDGTPALLNRHFVNADVRVVTGFIEPHFFAGFSGGPKGIMPGLAGLETVMSNHGTANLGHPNATFGITSGNPVWEEMRDIALRPGPSFLLNVALNEQRQITGVYAGDLVAAHRIGCEFVRNSAMQKVEAPFEIVLTTNSGYPLDLNLYQGVKGMSAGARVLKRGGTLIVACECREGVPAGSNYDRLLRRASSLEEILAQLTSSGRAEPEQWQVQIQALIEKRAKILLHSSLPDEIVRAAHLTPCADIAGTVRRLLDQNGNGTRIAVLPQGPLTIPYLAGSPG